MLPLVWFRRWVNISHCLCLHFIKRPKCLWNCDCSFTVFISEMTGYCRCHMNVDGMQLYFKWRVSGRRWAWLISQCHLLFQLFFLEKGKRAHLSVKLPITSILDQMTTSSLFTAELFFQALFFFLFFAANQYFYMKHGFDFLRNL